MPTLPVLSNDLILQHDRQQVALFNQILGTYLQQYKEIWANPVQYFAARGVSSVNIFATAAATVGFLLSFNPTCISPGQQVPPTSWVITPNEDGTVTIVPAS